MTIIKEGEPRPIAFECSHCGCVFGATTKEYVLRYVGEYARYGCDCPYCHTTVIKAVSREKP